MQTDKHVYQDYEIYGDGTFGQKLIRQTNGKTGPVPITLQGSFTTASFAMRAIDSHIANLPVPKVKQKVSSKGKLILEPKG